MVLSLKTWKSRSLPVLPRTFASPLYDDLSRRRPAVADEKTAARNGGRFVCGAALRKQVGRRGVASAAAFRLRRAAPKAKRPPSLAAVFHGSEAFASQRDHRVRRSVLGRAGSDLLFQVLRLSTIGAGEFYGRVRDGIGYRPPAKTTSPAKDE